MHYRRMDPQPSRGGGVFCAGAAIRVSYWIGGVLHPAPMDMPGAEPWCDRDGEWYWRSTPDDALSDDSETPAPHVNTGTKDCPKCGGAGWCWGYQLDNPSEDTYADSMTRYSCDDAVHTKHGTECDCYICNLAYP